MKADNNLRDIRTMYGLSQDDIAKAMGIKSRSTIVAIEKGDRDITSEELGRLADHLGVEITDLLAQDMPNYDKYKEMILEMLRRYTKYANKSATKTLLAKLVYLTDFAWYYDELQPMSGMKYRRLQYGPVPDQYFRIVDELVDDGLVNLTLADRAQWLSVSDSAQGLPLEQLATKETALIDLIARKWKDTDTEKIVAFTHTQLPWQICRPNEFIPYELITQEEPDRVY